MMLWFNLIEFNNNNVRSIYMFLHAISFYLFVSKCVCVCLPHSIYLFALWVLRQTDFHAMVLLFPFARMRTFRVILYCTCVYVRAAHGQFPFSVCIFSRCQKSMNFWIGTQTYNVLGKGKHRSNRFPWH